MVIDRYFGNAVILCIAPGRLNINNSVHDGNLKFELLT
jgi:hypothetical protein